MERIFYLLVLISVYTCHVEAGYRYRPNDLLLADLITRCRWYETDLWQGNDFIDVNSIANDISHSGRSLKFELHVVSNKSVAIGVSETPVFFKDGVEFVIGHEDNTHNFIKEFQPGQSNRIFTEAFIPNILKQVRPTKVFIEITEGNYMKMCVDEIYCISGAAEHAVIPNYISLYSDHTHTDFFFDCKPRNQGDFLDHIGRQRDLLQ